MNWSAAERPEGALGVTTVTSTVPGQSGRSWVAVQEDTVARLTRYRRDHGLHSFDACFDRLLTQEPEGPSADA